MSCYHDGAKKYIWVYDIQTVVFRDEMREFPKLNLK